MTSFRKSLAIDVDHFGASLHLANVMLRIGQGQSAAKYFLNAIRLRPESANAHFGLVLAVHLSAKDSQAAHRHFTETLKHDPLNFEVLT